MCALISNMCIQLLWVSNHLTLGTPFLFCRSPTLVSQTKSFHLNSCVVKFLQKAIAFSIFTPSLFFPFENASPPHRPLQVCAIRTTFIRHTSLNPEQSQMPFVRLCDVLNEKVSLSYIGKGIYSIAHIPKMGTLNGYEQFQNIFPPFARVVRRVCEAVVRRIN